MSGPHLPGPADWVRALTPAGKPYWYSRSTARTTWLDPTAPAVKTESTATTAANTNTTATTSTTTATNTTATKPPWRRVDGPRPYYYNSITKKTQWTRPPHFPHDLPPGWVRHAPADARPYYYHAATRRTSYTLPTDTQSQSQSQSQSHPESQTKKRPASQATTTTASTTVLTAANAKRHKTANADATSNWRENTAPDGRIYFYNVVTRQTAWSRPPLVDSATSRAVASSPKRARSGPVAERPRHGHDHEREGKQEQVVAEEGEDDDDDDEEDVDVDVDMVDVQGDGEELERKKAARLHQAAAAVKRPRDSYGKPFTDRDAERYFLMRADMRREKQRRRTMNANSNPDTTSKPTPTTTTTTTSTSTTATTTPEQRLNDFYALLRERGMHAGSSWLQVMARCADDARYKGLSSYGARKAAWHKMCARGAVHKRRASTLAERSAKADYVRVLEDALQKEPSSVRSLAQCSPATRQQINTFASSVVTESQRAKLTEVFFNTRVRAAVAARKAARAAVARALARRLHPSLRELLDPHPGQSEDEDEEEGKGEVTKEKKEDVKKDKDDETKEKEEEKKKKKLVFDERTPYRELEAFIRTLPRAAMLDAEDISDVVRAHRRVVDRAVDDRDRAARRAAALNSAPPPPRAPPPPTVQHPPPPPSSKPQWYAGAPTTAAAAAVELKRKRGDAAREPDSKRQRQQAADEENGWTAAVANVSVMTDAQKAAEKQRRKREILQSAAAQ